MDVTGIVKLDKCGEIFTQNDDVMNILATGKFGLVYGNMDSPNHQMRIMLFCYRAGV